MLLEQPSVEKTKHELYVRAITKNIACFFYNFNRVYENKYRFSKLHRIIDLEKVDMRAAGFIVQTQVACTIC